jgi:hypothetical protein
MMTRVLTELDRDIVIDMLNGDISLKRHAKNISSSIRLDQCWNGLPYTKLDILPYTKLCTMNGRTA